MTETKYKKKNVTKEWLMSNGFRYNRMFSDSETEAYTYRFPVYKHDKFTVLECELKAILGEEEIGVNVYDYNTNDRYAPFYYCEYGNYNRLLNRIHEKIEIVLKKMKIEKMDPHKTIKVGTGLAVQPPKGYFGAIFARSGLSAKSGVRPANCVVVCDQDYTGEYIVALHNDTECSQVINPGDKIAQLVFLPYTSVNFYEVMDLDYTVSDDDGLGSTGK